MYAYHRESQPIFVHIIDIFNLITTKWDVQASIIWICLIKNDYKSKINKCDTFEEI